MNNQTHLKKIDNGRVFLFSENLRARGDMVPCDSQGNITTGHVGDAASIEAGNTRRKTKFLGNVNNGVLYPYTEYLAERDDMVSIDTPEQWALMQRNGDASAQADNVVVPTIKKEAAKPAPSLGRADKAEPEAVKEPEPVVTSDVEAPGEHSLPAVEGMGAREAKTILADWAKDKFGVEIDRREKLDVVIDNCRILSMKSMDKAAGQ